MKTLQTIKDLAINGAKPMFNDPHYVGKPNVGNKDYFFSLVNEIFDTKRLTNGGPFLKDFEEKLAKFLNVKYALAVCNATIGLEIAVKALGLKGEVIVPAFTFVATAHCLNWLGVKPIFVDVDPITYNIDASAVRKAITPNTTGILGVHLWGRPCNIQELEEIAKEYNLKLFFDAAHAFGCSYKNEMVGNFGDCEVFSFHATKFFNTFEGGLITTNDPKVAEKIRLMRNFGFTGTDMVEYVGTNGKMTEICAAFGLTNLLDFDNILNANKDNYSTYSTNLSGIKGIKLVEYRSDELTNYSYIIIKVNENEYGISRDELCNILTKENIFARKYFYPGIHKLGPYFSEECYSSLSLPITDDICKKVLALPTYKSVSESDIIKICRLIDFVGKTQNI